MDLAAHANITKDHFDKAQEGKFLFGGREELKASKEGFSKSRPELAPCRERD